MHVSITALRGLYRISVYIDGRRFGNDHGSAGQQFLGIEIGAAEKRSAGKILLVGLRKRGLRTDR